jgi:GT2 family glycosyltransferase
MRLTISIATCKRPQPLSQLLDGIAKQKFTRSPQPEIRVVVIDNDAAGSAREVCREHPLPWPLTHIVEPKRGIASARNRGLRNAQDADWVALIDDDEVPDPAWLDELLWAQVTFGADVVTGPVIPEYGRGVHGWAIKGRFFERHIYPSGERLTWCASNNTLIRRRVLETVGKFDEGFALTGGEDLHYFMRTHRAGFRIIFSAPAIVREAIGIDRANVKDILLRAYRCGNSNALVERAIDRRGRSLAIRLTKGILRTIRGVLCAPLYALIGRAGLVHALRDSFAGAGMLAALIGVKYEPYRNIKGQTTIIAGTVQ